MNPDDVYLIGHDDWGKSTLSNRVVRRTLEAAVALAMTVWHRTDAPGVLVLGAWGMQYLAQTTEVRELWYYGRGDAVTGLPNTLYGIPIVRDYTLDDSTFCRVSFPSGNVWIDMKGAPC